jgi:hypothetical protein
LCLRYFATHGFCFGRVTSCIVGVIVPYERRFLYDGAAFKEKDDAEGSTRCRRAAAACLNAAPVRRSPA